MDGNPNGEIADMNPKLAHRLTARCFLAPLLVLLSAIDVPADDAEKAAADAYPILPEAVTSFGAAVQGHDLYIYGGHMGRAHEYYKQAQANTLYKLNLAMSSKWEKLSTGPRVQGLAMVTYRGMLYRIGGFSALNNDGDEKDLHSQDDVARFDPEGKKWQDLAPLPQPRSSFDAAVLDGKIYVVGGWRMQGEKDAVWHDSAYALDLNSGKLGWSQLPKPPFVRRALSVAAYDGKIYAVGGMQESGKPSTEVFVFDPAKNDWSKGPNLIGEPLEGFGSSAFAQNGRLYVSTIKGNLQRLNKDGSAWETVQQLKDERFFHRMLPYGTNKLLMIGGANMGVGKFDTVGVIEVD
ncbi:MAG: N-acetylneuraminic acid mutarotase [Mariniblastus sp.]